MDSRYCLLFITAAVVAAGAAFSSAAEMRAGSDPTAKTFESLRNLAGEWVAVGEDGQPTDSVISSFRVTAGGSAVIETLFPGSDHEMVTVYHRDGDDLVLTHYCVLGNQPRMKYVNSANPDQLVFNCSGGSNMRSEKDAHMHQGTMQVVDGNHIKAEWLKFENGEHTYTASFDLMRKEAN